MKPSVFKFFTAHATVSNDIINNLPMRVRLCDRSNIRSGCTLPNSNTLTTNARATAAKIQRQGQAHSSHQGCEDTDNDEVASITITSLFFITTAGVAQKPDDTDNDEAAVTIVSLLFIAKGGNTQARP